LNQASQQVKDNITSLGGELQGGMLVLQECDSALQNLQNALRTVNTPAKRLATTTYQDCQKDIKSQTISLANGLSNLLNTCNKNPDQIGVSARELSDLVTQLIEATRIAAVVTRLPEVQKQLLTSVVNVGRGAAGMIQNAKKVAANSQDRAAASEVSNGLTQVTNAVSNLLVAVKSGATAEKEIEQAVDQIAKIKSDLDTAALFAASGQFSAQVEEGRSVEDSVNELKSTLKDLISKSFGLVDASKGYQEQFAAAAKQTAQVTNQCSVFTRETASLLSDLVSQQSVLTGARAVSIAVEQMVLAGKEAQANPLDNKASQSLSNAVEGVSQACEELINLTDIASADVIVTIKELQKAIREIRSALKQYYDPSYSGVPGATPTSIFDAAKLLVRGNGKLLSAYGSSQEEFLASVTEVFTKAVLMIQHTKAGRGLTGDAAIHAKLDDTLKNSANAVIAFLENGKVQRIDDPSYYKKFSEFSEACTLKLNDFVAVIKLLPGGKDFSWEDNEDENVVESELQAAINAIEAAKNRLLDAANWTPVQGAIDLGEVASQIVDATKNIAMATQFLVVTATEVQNEIVSQGRASSKKLGQVYKRDPAWQEGLISAAKAVAGTTEDLVNFANQCVRGESGEEMLIACVRGVGGATARLVSAAKAKADPFSSSHQALGSGAKRVAEATQQLADATKAATEKKVEEQMKSRAPTTSSFAGLRSAELEEQARIAKLELELERARQNLFQKRKKEYRS
jgi:talin